MNAILHRAKSRSFTPLLVLSLALGPMKMKGTEPPQAHPSPESSTNTLQAYKRMSLEELMNQDVTSVSREPEPFGKAPAALVVINQEDIHRSGVESLPDALRLADNLDVAQATSSSWRISARGFNSSVGNKLLVLTDGRTVYTPLLSGVIWNMQDYLLEDLDRIEVISGPGGTLWGENAFNGVINIVSKDAKDTQGFYGEAGGGTWLQDFVGVRYGGTLASNVYYRVYGKYFDQRAEEFPDGTTANDAWRRGQGGFRIDYDAEAGNHLTLQGDGYGGTTGVLRGGEGLPAAEGSASGGNVLGRWTHTLADDSDMSLQLYYDRVNLGAPFQAFPPFGVPAGDLNDHLDTYDLDFQHRFAWGERQHFVWGMGYRHTHDAEEPAPLVAFLPATVDRNLFSVFIQDEIKLVDKVYLTLGSKVEHNDYTGFEYEPSIRLQWNLTSNQMVWGAVSRAIRAPSRFDRDLNQPGPGYPSFLAGNTTFKSETVIAYELGYRAELGHHVSGSLSTFYNDYDHLRSLNSANPPAFLPVIDQNNLHGHTDGVELSTTFQVLEGWRLHAGYDWLQEHIVVGSGGDLNKGLNETADPKHQIFLRSSMDLPHGVELDAFFRWIDTVRFNNGGGTMGNLPSCSELDMRVAWHATKNVEFSIVAQNLLHERHLEAGSGPSSFGATTQEAIIRNIYGKVSWRF